jgi:O-antigen ligase
MWSLLRERKIAAFTLCLALWAVPVSISITESLLAIALAVRIATILRGRASVSVPRIFCYWLLWAALELLSWLHSPDLKAGLGEMKHLLVVAALFLVMPVFDRPAYAVAAWRGIFLTATISSAVLIFKFVWRLAYHPRDLPIADYAVIHARNGGLLNHWMVYGTVEVVIFAGLLEFWHLYPEQRRWLLPMFGLNGLAISLSLTRMLWVSCLVVLAVHLVWRHSRWAWSIPFLPMVLFVVAPGVVRSRVIDSLKPDYYSNTERLQMLRVGWKMILEKPLTGVGPGRIEGLYLSYLSPQDPIPAYHGHLHNNLFQLGAEFGLPVVAAAVLFLTVLFKRLIDKCRSASDRETAFLCRSALLGLAGFIVAGMFEYTYGHSLGLILLSFVVLNPLTVVRGSVTSVLSISPTEPRPSVPS